MARVSTKKTIKKPAKAAPEELLPAPATETSAPSADLQPPQPTPSAEPELPAERTVDSIKAAATEDAKKDSSRFPDESSRELRPPSAPIEPTGDEWRPGNGGGNERRGFQRDKIATSLNIAKLQGMQMGELNAMAKEYGVENFGTMRKHEVIFHILEKNAARAGVLFSEGVIEVLPEGFGFLRSQSFNYLPLP